MNWEKLRSPAIDTLKNLNFWSLCELGKTWKYSLETRSQSPNFESIDEFRKSCPNLSFTVENNIENLKKTSHISNLSWWMRYSISSNFKNLSMNWEKYLFHWEKYNFQPIENFAHTTENFLRKLPHKDPVNTLTPLFPNVNNANIISNR